MNWFVEVFPLPIIDTSINLRIAECSGIDLIAPMMRALLLNRRESKDLEVEFR